MIVDCPYYAAMLKKHRLIPFFEKLRLVCFITFYIGEENEENKFVREDMWKVLEDSKDGNCCFIDQLITDKNLKNPKLSYGIWKRFKKYIKKSFPSVKIIRWNRLDKEKNIVRTYRKEI